MDQGIIANEYNEKQNLKSDLPVWSPRRRKSKIRQIVRRYLLFESGLKSAQKEPLRPTAWLDGLRGFAAFLVYWHHHQLWAHQGTGQNGIFEAGYGYDGKFYVASMHGIRTFFSGGHFAVATFFVISGYVLSYKPLILIHAREYEKLDMSLSSSFFRRWIRLYLPVVCTTFLWMSSWHAFGLWTPPFEPQKTYREELWKWYADFKNYSFVFRGPGGLPWMYYNLHTWSVPVEFRGSIIIFGALLALSRSTKTARLLTVAGLILGSLYIVNGWWIAMFLAGLLLCDLDLLSKEKALPRFLAKVDSILTPIKGPMFLFMFFASIYLGGVPSLNNDYEILKNSPGWQALSALKPNAMEHPKWFFLFWGAVFLVAAIPRQQILKSFFTSSFNQYLGRISYSLYLVHGPMIWIVGDKLYLLLGWSKDPYHFQHPPAYFKKYDMPKFGPFGMEPAFLLPHLIMLPVTLWVATLVTKVFDEPSISFAAWLQKKTLPSLVK
jgi:peptidoglycan/LPS O-acetylase OafA/YrhL